MTSPQLIHLYRNNLRPVVLGTEQAPSEGVNAMPPMPAPSSAPPLSTSNLMTRVIMTILAIACIGAGAALVNAAHGHDYGQWDKSSPDIREWYARQMRPDYPTSSCCGEGDGYWADDYTLEDGHIVAVITDNRDDAPLQRRHIPVGTKIIVPLEKMNLGLRDPNPTGHGIVFVGASNTNVFCWFPPVGG